VSDGPAARAGATPPERLGYLLSKYPAANHTYLLREVRALRRAGVEVVVAAVDGDDRPPAALSPEEREERAATFVVKARGAARIVADHLATLASRPGGYVAGVAHAVRLARGDLPRLAYNLFYFAEAVVAGRHLRARGCTHLHTHYATNVAVLAARVFGLELSASIHGSAEFIDPSAQRLREKVAACTFVRAISSYGRSQLMLATPPSEWAKFAVVRLGVDPDGFPEVPPRRSAGAFRLASVGQLQPAKGYHLLLDACAALVAAGHDVRLTLAGDGPSRRSLEAHTAALGLAGRVAFPGAVNHDEVLALFAETDAFVLPSFAEGIPVVLMEAMASGLPCVASRITGIPELIVDGESGLLVTPAETGELADAIARLAGDDALRARLGCAGRARVRAAYDLDRNVGHLVELFAARVTAAG
jgi:glycosyltransferase involved in cell wall biosynthesis